MKKSALVAVVIVLRTKIDISSFCYLLLLELFFLLTFDAIDTVKGCLALFTGMVRTMKFNKEIMADSAMNGFTNATDAADYLVNKGVPFRDAHGIIGRLVLFCIEKNCSIDDLSLEGDCLKNS